MKKLILLIAFFATCNLSFADTSNWQPVTSLDELNGIVIRLHQELEAIKELAKEAEKFDGQGHTNFEHEDFIKAIEILQTELQGALKTRRLLND